MIHAAVIAIVLAALAPRCPHCGSPEHARPSLDVRSAYPTSHRCPDCWKPRP